MKDVEKLNYRPFTRFCMSIGAVPSSYLAGLTIEEQILWFCSYLEKEVVPTINNNADVVQEIQDFIDNLNIGEYVDEKIDQMVEDGTFMALLAEYFPFVTPEMYGAAGDGETDDHQAFVDMFANPNREIHLHNDATYLLSEKLYVEDTDNIIIQGNDATLKLDHGTESTQIAPEYGTLNFDNCNNLVINNLIIDSSAPWYMRPHKDWGGVESPEWDAWLALRNRTYCGLALISLKNANITNVKCMNTRAGFDINHCEKVTLEACESNKTFADGIYITNASKYCYINNHYCENTGDDCYSSDGWANALNEYIYFTDCTAHISGGALLCADTTNHTYFTNLSGDELNYTPFKYEAHHQDCADIVVENCVGITNNNMELEQEHGMPVGGRRETWMVRNVEVRNSTIINKNPTTRRIEWIHQRIEGIKYINCYVENLTPLFYSNTSNVYIEGCKFETQDAFSLIDTSNVKLLNNILHNNSYFNDRGNANIFLLRTTDTRIENNQLSVVASNSHDITFTGNNSYLTADTEDMAGSNTQLSHYKFLGMLYNTYWATSVDDGQLCMVNNEPQKITNNSYTGNLNTTLTGNGITVTLKRRGNLVVAQVSGTNTEEMAANSYFVTLPADYRPVADYNMLAFTLSGKRYLVGVKTDGRFGAQWVSQTLPANETFLDTFEWLVG